MVARRLLLISTLLLTAVPLLMLKSTERKRTKFVYSEDSSEESLFNIHELGKYFNGPVHGFMHYGDLFKPIIARRTDWPLVDPYAELKPAPKVHERTNQPLHGVHSPPLSKESLLLSLGWPPFGNNPKLKPTPRKEPPPKVHPRPKAPEGPSLPKTTLPTKVASTTFPPITKVTPRIKSSPSPDSGWPPIGHYQKIKPIPTSPSNMPPGPKSGWPPIGPY